MDYVILYLSIYSDCIRLFISNIKTYFTWHENLLIGLTCAVDITEIEK